MEAGQGSKALRDPHLCPPVLRLALPCSIFGLFSVPTWAFPWALLVIWQLLVPRASLLGHLTGLLVGRCFRSPGSLLFAVLGDLG